MSYFILKLHETLGEIKKIQTKIKKFTKNIRWGCVLPPPKTVFAG
jgi:hypothetical protein